MALLTAQDWGSVGHSIQSVWFEFVGHWGLLFFLALFLLALVRAALRQHRYRAVGVLDQDDIEALRDEIVAAEKRTVGEILPVILERSDPHPGALWRSAVFVLFLGSALLASWLPWDQPLWVLTIQFLLGTAGYLLALALPDYKRLFIREARATEVACEQALQEFFQAGLHETEERTGVLLFVSLLEHRSIVLADEGIHAKVSQDCWVETDKAILGGIRAGSLREGLIAGTRACADVLAQHFPWREGDRNEIPDRILVRRE